MRKMSTSSLGVMYALADVLVHTVSCGERAGGRKAARKQKRRTVWDKMQMCWGGYDKKAAGFR